MAIGPPRRVNWDRVSEVHLEPVATGDDSGARWLINLRAAGGEKIQIDSVNVRGTADFEHKTEEFLAILGAIHQALAPYPTVRYRVGTRRLILVAWRVALFLLTAAGLLATGAALVIATLAMAGLGISGLAMLRRRGGPVPYDPNKFAAAGAVTSKEAPAANPR